MKLLKASVSLPFVPQTQWNTGVGLHFSLDTHTFFLGFRLAENNVVCTNIFLIFQV